MKPLAILLFFGLILTLGCSTNSEDSGPTGVANNAPVIQSVNASPGEVCHEGSSSLVCIATDADRDSLSYVWIARVGSISSDGAEAEWIAPWEAGTYFVKVTVNDGVALDVDSVQIIVLQNRPPVITSLSSGSEEIVHGSKTSIICTATDADDDNLTYEWFAQAGEIQGNGANAQWHAPISSGNYWIMVTVNDGFDIVSDSTQVTVLANRPPIIRSLVANPTVVEPLGTSELYCIATDGDGDNLTYGWLAQHGEIQGDEAYALWSAPVSSGDYWIWIFVYDGYDGDSDSVQLKVNSPPSQPYDPYPVNGESNAPTSLTLTWHCIDPDGDSLTYDFYFGNSRPRGSLIARDIEEANFQIEGLNANTTYYWGVQARDIRGAVSPLTSWNFHTR